jgi:hypothetical protein
MARILEGPVPVRNGSIRMLDLPVSMRKLEWPNQVICMACLVLGAAGRPRPSDIRKGR